MGVSADEVEAHDALCYFGGLHVPREQAAKPVEAQRLPMRTQARVREAPRQPSLRRLCLAFHKSEGGATAG